MDFLFSILPTIVVLGILIIIHEFGHFIACRRTKVNVEKFSIGFGPEIVHWERKGTRFAISIFPIGGYVKPAGESVSEIQETGTQAGDFLAATVPARIFIVISGVIMNYLLGYLLFFALSLSGIPEPGTAIGGFVKGYPAEDSGLKVGDRIVEVNGQKVTNWHELTDLFNKAPDGTLILVVTRGQGVATVPVMPETKELTDVFGHRHRVKRVGIMHHMEDFTIKRLGLMEALINACQTTVFVTMTTYKAIFYMIQGRLSLKAVYGPIGIITLTGSAVKSGFSSLLILVANLSVCLAVVNLLPIPALDGGHLLFLLIEAIRRKPVSLKIQERLTQAGFAMLLVLMAFVVYNDLVNLEYLEKIKKFFGG
ncbi:MAG: RIP metalloprotease RseP [Candidatus Omnitrophica bacterium]|nr:RIP metalloprotease RseP [Candidatus Omnitrophota bacterium]